METSELFLVFEPNKDNTKIEEGYGSVCENGEALYNSVWASLNKIQVVGNPSKSLYFVGFAGYREPMYAKLFFDNNFLESLVNDPWIKQTIIEIEEYEDYLKFGYYGVNKNNILDWLSKYMNVYGGRGIAVQKITNSLVYDLVKIKRNFVLKQKIEREYAKWRHFLQQMCSSIDIQKLILAYTCSLTEKDWVLNNKEWEATAWELYYKDGWGSE